jgi:hypothetical protein
MLDEMILSIKSSFAQSLCLADGVVVMTDMIIIWVSFAAEDAADLIAFRF